MDDDPNGDAKNTNDVKNLYETAQELLLEREVNETRKEVLFVGHVASWLNFDEEPGFLLGKDIPRWMSRKFQGARARRYTGEVKLLMDNSWQLTAEED